MQTTAIDRERGLLCLRRARPWLGQWIASEWPVCPLADSSAPSMGAAMTYARRYALFALLGSLGKMISTRPISISSRSKAPRPWLANLEGASER